MTWENRKTNTCENFNLFYKMFNKENKSLQAKQADAVKV